jgi:alkanesulfonate monooxygenase SsuD/methylene tetrahydromethanopterin reductase-like flavin-dependent oxidoreductase (luciferase family)
VIVERQPTETGVALRDPYPWDDLAGLVRLAEDLGLRAVFLPEVGGRDTLAALTGLAGETSRLLLGTGVVPLPARSPQLLAMAAATVQERSGGRHLLGLGTGPDGRGALDRLRRTVVGLREVFSGRAARIDDDDVEISLATGTPPRIWVAALGPRAVRLGGEVADGVLLNWCTPERVARARRELAEGAAAAGRDPASVTLGVYVRGNLGVPPDEALPALRSAAAEYASYPAYARQLAGLGLGEEVEGAAAAHRGGRPDDVPARLVEEIFLPFDLADARARLDAYRDAGADLPIVYPVVRPGAGAFEAAANTIRAVVG